MSEPQPSRIKILPDHVVNRIAAGEVVERPASAVKELVENALDAGATDIRIDVEQAGKRLIRVADNGCGMTREDAVTAFERHATSKIASDSDLESVRTMGFRGEALASIAAVSRIRLLTATIGSAGGVLVERGPGEKGSVTDAAAPPGTTIEVRDLFSSTPARLKFLKSAATEFSHIVTAVSHQAMAHPEVRFRLTHGGKDVLDLPQASGVQERVFQVYGREIADSVVPFSGGKENIHLRGMIGKPATSRADRTHQEFFVNRRPVRSPALGHALTAAYGDMLMHGRHPVGFVFIEIDPALVDVNVHPAKTEIRFRNQSQMHDLMRDVIRENLRRSGIPAAPAAGEGVLPGAGVREALAGYLRSSPEGDRGAPPFFGRRKTDAASTGIRSEPAPSEEDRYTDLLPRGEGAPEHDLYPIAQIHDSFIVAQSSEGMAIIDQHAAHERVLFEQLQDQFEAGEVPSQALLVPDQVEPGPAQAPLLLEQLPELQRLGFQVEDFGNGTFMIKAVPALIVGGDYRALLLDVLDEVAIRGTSRKLEEIRDRVLSIMACHPAIKVNRHLAQQEMETLLNRLFKCRMPHTCPHGRPTVIRFSMDDLKKMFKRT